MFFPAVKFTGSKLTTSIEHFCDNVINVVLLFEEILILSILPETLIFEPRSESVILLKVFSGITEKYIIINKIHNPINDDTNAIFNKVESSINKHSAEFLINPSGVFSENFWKYRRYFGFFLKRFINACCLYDVMAKNKLSQNHMKLLDFLRQNSRQSFADIHKQTRIPTSTLFDYYSFLKNKSIITKTVSLIDFKKLNYPIRKIVFIKAHKKLKLYKFLIQSYNINSVSKIKTYDFCFEIFFRDFDESEKFFEKLNEFDILLMQKHDILEEIKSEGFLCLKSS